jgi:hypothetical protein
MVHRSIKAAGQLRRPLPESNLVLTRLISLDTLLAVRVGQINARLRDSCFSGVEENG